MSGFLKDLFKTVTTGDSFVGKVLDKVTDYIPTKESKARLEMDIRAIAHEQQIDMVRIEHAITSEFNQRTKDLEGTASDLKQAGWLGRIVLFLRGIQRPVWGFIVMKFDYDYFMPPSTYTERGELLLMVINILVLGFLFGERAIKNVMPLITEFLVSKKAK